MDLSIHQETAGQGYEEEASSSKIVAL